MKIKKCLTTSVAECIINDIPDIHLLSQDKTFHDVVLAELSDVERKNILSNELPIDINRVVQAVGTFKKDEEKKFTDEIVNVVTSDEFISQLFEEIGPPTPSESLGCFVERGKNILRTKLYNMFRIEK
jgi:hypothetical protein